VIADLYLLDSGPLGLATNPKDSPDAQRCKAWLRECLSAGSRVMIPQVIGYEVRRELLRVGKLKGIAQLDALADRLGTIPVDERVWNLAAEMWARARQEGRPTASNAALDIDVILAATAIVASEDGSTVVVVTDNVGHLGRYVDGRDWRTLASP
jgi:predicted nucleic acid-binding protein